MSFNSLTTFSLSFSFVAWSNSFIKLKMFTVTYHQHLPYILATCFHSHLIWYWYWFFYFLYFHFHLLMALMFCHFHFHFILSWLSDSNVLSVKIVSNKSLNNFNNSLCLGVCFLYFIVSACFILFNVFKYFLADNSLIVLFLILLTKYLMPVYLNSPILFL